MSDAGDRADARALATVARERLHFDFVIAGTGYAVDVKARRT